MDRKRDFDAQHEALWAVSAAMEQFTCCDEHKQQALLGAFQALAVMAIAGALSLERDDLSWDQIAPLVHSAAMAIAPSLFAAAEAFSQTAAGAVALKYPLPESPDERR